MSINIDIRSNKDKTLSETPRTFLQKAAVVKRWPWIVYLILGIDLLAVMWMYERRPGQIPTLILSSVALGFSYYAYRFSKEKFRLDLLDRRWEIYQQVLNFCSIVITHGGRPKHGADERINKEVIFGLDAAHESFRGIGFHKARALFGPEVHEKFEKLNEMYAWFVVCPRHEGWADMESQYIRDILKTIEELPAIFKPYVYFGDYRD